MLVSEALSPTTVERLRKFNTAGSFLCEYSGVRIELEPQEPPTPYAQEDIISMDEDGAMTVERYLAHRGFYDGLVGEVLSW